MGGATRPTWSHPGEALRLFLAGVTVRTASKVAAVVGTVLSVVNQGSVILDGNATASTWVRVGVNYLVPFLVSSVGFLSACRNRDAG
ncbi:MAG: nitrate/nitrite transporter NrtS [Acidimicrobiia bacterium]